MVIDEVKMLETDQIKSVFAMTHNITSNSRSKVAVCVGVGQETQFTLNKPELSSTDGERAFAARPPTSPRIRGAIGLELEIGRRWDDSWAAGGWWAVWVRLPTSLARSWPVKNHKQSVTVPLRLRSCRFHNLGYDDVTGNSHDSVTFSGVEKIARRCGRVGRLRVSLVNVMDNIASV